MGDRLARRVGVEREPDRVVAVTADRRLDPAGARCRDAANERGIRALERAFPDEVGKAAVRLLGARDDHQARRVAVEPMDDAGPSRLPAGNGAGEQVDERSARPARAWMDDEAGRLVDDGEVLVLPGDRGQRARRCRLRRGLLGCGKLDALAPFEAVALRARPPVDERPAVDRPCGGRPRAEVGGEEDVEPVPCGLGGNVQHRSADFVQPSQSRDIPAAGGG